MNYTSQPSNQNQFSVRLANGQEQTFASAAEMASWVQKQREHEYLRRPSKRKSARRTPKNASPRNSQWAGKPPLARYAKTGSR